MVVSAITPSSVTGNVTWSNGTVVDGAIVKVTCEHGGVNDSVEGTSMLDGSYNVIINSTDCDYNDKVWVMASIDGLSGMNSGVMCDSESCFIPIAIINIQIPEFGLLGAMLVVLAGVGMVAYSRK